MNKGCPPLKAKMHNVHVQYKTKWNLHSYANYLSRGAGFNIYWLLRNAHAWNITVKVFLLVFLQCTVKTRPVTIDRVRYKSHRFDDNCIFIHPFYNMREADLQIIKKNPGETYRCCPYQVPLKKICLTTKYLFIMFTLSLKLNFK